jgi:hypothetical protein
LRLTRQPRLIERARLDLDALPTARGLNGRYGLANTQKVSLATTLVSSEPENGFSIQGRNGNFLSTVCLLTSQRRDTMGKGILLWLLGIPIPIILLILLFWH